MRRDVRIIPKNWKHEINVAATPTAVKYSAKLGPACELQRLFVHRLCEKE